MCISFEEKLFNLKEQQHMKIINRVAIEKCYRHSWLIELKEPERTQKRKRYINFFLTSDIKRQIYILQDKAQEIKKRIKAGATSKEKLLVQYKKIISRVRKLQNRNKKLVNVYGVFLTSLENMAFDKWLDNKNQLGEEPAPNTLKSNERKELVYTFLKQYKERKQQ